MIDVLVAGGGPVGLAAAVHAARAGLDVVVVEPRCGPIDKACGEGLMPDALQSLSALGVDPDGVDIAGIRYLSGSRVAEARFSAGPGRGVRRTVLHQALLSRALDLGVSVVAGKVVALAQTPDHVETAGIRSRYLVAADGLHSDVRRAVGLQSVGRGPRRYGVRQHFRTSPQSDLVEVHWLDDQEVYVTPVGADLVGVAVLGRPPLSLASAIARLPRLASHLAGAPTVGARRGAGPFRQATSSRVAGRVLLVGDAAGYVDALTGEGMRIGFAEAYAAVAAIMRDRPEDYEADWRRITRSYRAVTNTLVWVGGRPALRPLVVPLAHALPGAFTRLVDRVAG